MRSDLWYDELYSCVIARQSFCEMLRTLFAGADANPPLYIVVLHFWLKICQTDSEIKMLSLLFGCAVIPATYFAARAIGGKKLGGICCLLMAVSLPAIGYSSEVRAYSMLLMLSVLSTGLWFGLLMRASDGAPRIRLRKILYCVVTVLMLYAHWFGFLIVGIQVLALIIYRPSLRNARAYAVCITIVLVSCLPLIPVFRNESAMRVAAGGFLWAGRPGIRSLFDVVAFLCGNKTLLSLSLLLFGAACFGFGTQMRADRATLRHLIFSATYFIVPIALIFAISNWLQHYSFFVQRYFLPFVLGVEMLIGLSLLRVRRVFSLIVLLAFVTAPVIRAARHSQNADRPYSEAASVLPSSYASDEVILHASPMSFFPIRHYARADNRGAVEKVVWSKAAGESFPVRVDLSGGLLRADDLIDVGSIDRYREIWVVEDPLDHDGVLEQTLDELRADPMLYLESSRKISSLTVEHYISLEEFE